MALRGCPIGGPEPDGYGGVARATWPDLGRLTWVVRNVLSGGPLFVTPPRWPGPHPGALVPHQKLATVAPGNDLRRSPIIRSCRSPTRRRRRPARDSRSTRQISDHGFYRFRPGALRSDFPPARSEVPPPVVHVCTRTGQTCFVAAVAIRPSPFQTSARRHRSEESCWRAVTSSCV